MLLNDIRPFTHTAPLPTFQILPSESPPISPAQCQFRLACGHQCPRRCHPDDPNHVAAHCPRPCERLRDPSECPSGHPCPLLCGDRCGPCLVPVPSVELPCGHKAVGVPCSRSLRPEDLAGECEAQTELAAHPCGHRITVECCRRAAIAADPSRCPAKCGASLRCGHACLSMCGSCLTSRRAGMRRSLNTRRAADEANDAASAEAAELGHNPCRSLCGRPLGCGHLCESKCHAVSLVVGGSAECNPCARACVVECEHTRCPLPCAKPCSPCIEPCAWSACPHGYGGCGAPCGAPCDALPCDEVCGRPLKCGHPCPAPCGERCPDPAVVCRHCAPAEKLDAVVDLQCMTTLREHNATMDGPLVELPCGHVYAASTLDAHMELGQYYYRGPEAVGGGARGSGVTGGVEQRACGCWGGGPWAGCLALPDRLQVVLGCPECRAPILGLRRYGRVVNKAILDQMTRRYGQKYSLHFATCESVVTNWYKLLFLSLCF